MNRGSWRRKVLGGFREALIRAILALPFVAGGGAASSVIPPEALGKPVGAIRFDSPVMIDDEDFRREIPLRSGRVLESAALRDSVAWLREKEIFSSVEVEVTPAGAAVDVRFLLRPTDVVVGVDVDGARSVSETEILRRARLREDEPLTEAKAAAALERLQSLYADRGFPDARISIRSREGRPGRVRVLIGVDEGEPVRLDRIEIEGLSSSAETEARQAFSFREGDIFTIDHPETGRNQLVRWFRERSYYEVEVRPILEVDLRKANLRFEVRPGPPFDSRVVGNRSIATERLLGLADLANRPIITDGTWRLLGRRMQELYWAEGYAFSEVGVAIGDGDRREVVFTVVEGPRVEVEAVRFRGANRLDRDDLLPVMQTRTATGIPFRAEPGWFRQETLTEDLERIRQRYRAAGHLQMEVSKVGLDYSPDRERLVVGIDVSEGPLTRVRSVTVAGDEGLLAGVRAGLKLRPGRPLDPDRLEQDRRWLLEALASRGYPDAAVSTSVEEMEGDPVEISVAVRYRVVPGRPSRIHRVFIKQNYFTLDRVLRRELPFRSGERFDPAKLLEGQRRIYRLGFFRSVAIRAVPSVGNDRDVIVRVVERPAGEVQYGFGYNTRAGLRSFAQIAHRNLLGTGRSVLARGELNLAPQNLVPDEYVATLEEREPHFGGTPFDLRSSFVVQRSERSIDEFSIRRLSFSTGLEREFFAGLQSAFVLEFEDSRVFDVAPDAILSGLDRGSLRTVSLNPLLVYDGRDDAFAPTRGVFDALRLRYGSPALGSEVHFLKMNLQHSHYVPLGKGVTLLYAARAGIAEPLGSSNAVPLRERFFLGGRTSVRGFEENSIGPKGLRGNPLGGDFLVSGNAEIRFPLAWGLEGAAFLDGGGLYLRDRVVSLAGIRESAGPGLRYQTPIGAISLDYGFKLDRRSGESIGEVHFTIGNVF